MLKYIPESWLPHINKKLIPNIRQTLDLEYKGRIPIYPERANIFASLNKTPFEDVRVVIIGQDPYCTCKYSDELKKVIPYATGLSFSIPKEIKGGKNFPPSLINIYSNLIKYKHMQSYPKEGNLDKWCEQGVLLLNRTLTVRKEDPNNEIHTYIWDNFTKYIIKNISDKKEDKVIFVLWGFSALQLIDLIDQNKHYVHISSHPSPKSNTKTLGEYPAFSDTDHFKIINDNLKDKIEW